MIRPFAAASASPESGDLQDWKSAISSPFGRQMGGSESAADPVGRRNDVTIRDLIQKCQLIVIAWGAHGALHNRDRKVIDMIRGRQLFCLGMTEAGQPRHPLYLSAETPLVTYSEPEA